MSYGNDSPLIGSNIDPRLFVQDYSPYERANERDRAMIASNINTAMNTVADYAKEQKAAKDALKSGQVQIEAAMKLFPDQADYLGQIANELKNEDTPLSARAEISKQTADYIAMTVGQKRYETDQHYRAKELDFRERDQSMQERESVLRQHLTGMNITDAENAAAQGAIDARTKEQLGTPLADSMLQLLSRSDPAMAASLAKNREGNTPAEDYALGNSIMALIPKSERKDLKVIDVKLGDGSSQQMQDDGHGRLIPLQVAGAATAGFDGSKLPAGLQPYAGAFAAAGSKYGVDPKVLAAISMHETGNGTSPAFRNKRNAMGISDANGPVELVNVEAGIDHMAQLLAAGAQGKGPYAGKTTVGEIAGTYAPVGAGNDPKGLNGAWTGGVSKALQSLGGNPAAPITTPPVGYTPAVTPQQAQEAKIQQEKHTAEMAATQEKKATNIAKSQQLVAALDKLENHPGFNNLFGTNVGVPTWIPGSSGADAKTIFKQIEGKGFIEAIQDMKGMGALSNAEGEKASAAFLGISPSMSEAAAKAQIKTIKDLVTAGIARTASGAFVNPDGSPKVPDPRATDAAALRGILGK